MHCIQYKYGKMTSMKYNFRTDNTCFGYLLVKIKKINKVLEIWSIIECNHPSNNQKINLLIYFLEINLD